MRYELIQAHELDDVLYRRWEALCSLSRDFASPYFRPEFTQAVAQTRPDAFVGLLKDGRDVVGFFPFHRRRGGIARPIGLGLSDYHGVIADPRAQFNAQDLLRGCRLIRFEFDHLIASQFTPFHTRTEGSPIISLAGGYDHYESTRDRDGRKHIREADRKRGRLEAEVGPVRFVDHSPDPAVLRTLIGWKSAQCRQTGVFDFFSLRWPADLLERIHAAGPGPFGGLLSCLYAGDTLAAAHFAMRSDTPHVWHSWFPAYNHDLDRYSPGSILLTAMIRRAAELGVDHIDLGKGLSTYKKRLMTGSIPVAEGRAAVPSLLNTARGVREKLERWGQTSSLRPVLRAPGRLVQSMERKARFN